MKLRRTKNCAIFGATLYIDVIVLTAILTFSAFSRQHYQFSSKFHVEGVAPTNHSFCEKL